MNIIARLDPTRHQLYGHLPPITKTIQVRRTRHAGHCWRSRDELIRDVLLWIPTHGRAKAGRPARTYIQQLCEDTGCCPEDLPRAMNDREKWRERVRDIRAASTIWWWWYQVYFKLTTGFKYIYIYTYIYIDCIYIYIGCLQGFECDHLLSFAIPFSFFFFRSYAPANDFSSQPNCCKFYHRLSIAGHFGSQEC